MNNLITSSDIINAELAETSLPFGVVDTSFSYDSEKSLSAQMAAFEKKILDESLKVNKNHISQTAEALNISRQTLYNKLNKYHLL